MWLRETDGHLWSNVSKAYQPPPDFWLALRGVLSTYPEGLKPPLIRDYLRVMDYVRTLEGQGTHQFYTLVWAQLAVITGIDESELRRELEDERCSLGGVEGCSWFKCPMFHRVPVDPPFRCTKCRRTAYCGTLCQERWVQPLS